MDIPFKGKSDIDSLLAEIYMYYTEIDEWSEGNAVIILRVLILININVQ